MNLRFLVFAVAFLLLATGTVWSQARIEEDEIESLIDEWNSANNARNIHSFEKVYGAQLTYYTENVSKAGAISRKQKFFSNKPWYRQRIVTEVKYKRYSGEVVRCDFTLEVFEKTHWKKYPTYLLVSNVRNRYVIVGESNYATDKTAERKDLGVTPEPMPSIPAPEPPVIEEQPAELPRDSSAIAINVHGTDSLETVDVPLRISDIPLLFSDMSSLGAVTIPRGYIVILIAMLGLGGLMIFIADSVQSRKRKGGQSVQRHDEAEHVVRNFKIQAGFEAFVTTLFDPLYFRHRRLKTEHVLAGAGVQAEKGPDLVFDFLQGDSHVSFAIKCQYYRHVAKNEVQLFDTTRQRHFRQFEEDRDMDVYYVLGFGGTPDDPKELFFIPAKAVTSEYIHKAMLRQYSKSGMFFYNRKTGKIQ